MNRLVTIFLIVAACSVASFAQASKTAETAKATDSAKPVEAVASVSQPADSTVVAPAETVTATEDPVTALNAEIALRDSVMGARDSVCSAEKSTLRKDLELEQAKCANWEQSYNTIKKNNEVCAQALSVSIGANEKNQERVEDERKKASMMTTTSFVSGVLLGMLLFWLIWD